MNDLIGSLGLPGALAALVVAVERGFAFGRAFSAARNSKNGNGNGHSSGDSAARAIAERAAAGEAATIIVGLQETRRVVDDTKELIDSMARTVDSNGALLAQLAEIAHKSDGRMTATEEATQAMSRMLQMHTGILDMTAQKVSDLHVQLPKRRGKR